MKNVYEYLFSKYHLEEARGIGVYKGELTESEKRKLMGLKTWITNNRSIRKDGGILLMNGEQACLDITTSQTISYNFNIFPRTCSLKTIKKKISMQSFPESLCLYLKP